MFGNKGDDEFKWFNFIATRKVKNVLSCSNRCTSLSNVKRLIFHECQVVSANIMVNTK